MATRVRQADTDWEQNSDNGFALLPETRAEFKRLVGSRDVQASLVAVLAGLGAALGSRYGEGGSAIGAIVGTVIGKRISRG